MTTTTKPHKPWIKDVVSVI